MTDPAANQASANPAPASNNSAAPDAKPTGSALAAAVAKADGDKAAADAAAAAAAAGKGGDDAAKKAADDAAAKKATGAPEKYEPFKLPEGFTVADERLGAFQALAKESNLPQESAQKYITMATDLVTELLGAQTQAWNDLVAQRDAALRSDKEIGGAKLSASIELAAQSIVRFGGKEALAELQQAGLDRSPAIVRMLVQIGTQLKDDDPGTVRGEGQPAEKTLAERMYPGHYSNGRAA